MIDAQLEDQREFVQWWRETVRPPGQGNNAERRYFSREQAEAATGISQHSNAGGEQTVFKSYRNCINFAVRTACRTAGTMSGTIRRMCLVDFSNVCDDFRYDARTVPPHIYRWYGRYDLAVREVEQAPESYPEVCRRCEGL